jgi:hypothetical protein
MTNTMLPGEAVIKTDAVGRMQTTAERRERLLDEFGRSGLSGTKFAALAGIKYSTFATWAARRRQRGPAKKTPGKPADPVRWLEAVVEQAKNPGGQPLAVLLVELPGGARVAVNDVQQVTLVAALLRTLARPC